MKRTGKILPQALKSLFRKPATVSYPVGREDVFPNVRGKLVFEEAKCVGCKMCVRDCPAKAIEIEKVADKQYKAILHIDHCIFCGQCVDSCHSNALKCTTEFELANLNRAEMKVDI
ncbi:MAG: 4Fe-4S binding protein [Treponema sp.]|nr:4Fe-4S binding protein [Treponema sp.]